MNYKGLYNTSYRTVNHKPVIYLFQRTKTGEKIVKKVTDFKPYLYIDSEVLASKRCSEIILIEEKEYKTIFGKSVKKCFVNHPSDVYEVKTFYGETFEADILFDLRYAIDEVDEVEKTKYKIATLDIETDTYGGFSRFENPIQPITCISVYDNYTTKTKTFVWREDITPKKEIDIYYFNNEREMLLEFLKYWRELNTDIVLGWNLQFDIKYLIARMIVFKIDYTKLSLINDRFDFNSRQTNLSVFIRQKGEAEILGVVLFDLFRAYKKMHFGELSSYSLNSIATDELGEQKEKVYNTGKVWREDLSKLISYNRKDVELTAKINDKCKLVSIFDDIRIFSGVRNINDCFYASRIHETRIMKKYRGKIIFPNKPPFKEKSKETRIKGAFVKEPTPGLYENVICIDAKSLYPSIIYTFNLSKEMIDEQKGVDINGVKFRQDTKGIMPSMIKELVELKDRMKEEVKGTGQDLSDKMFAIKIFINSFYGINALTSFRLYDKRVAETITYIGRYIVTKCSDMIEKEFNYKIIYNDTDSIFIQIPNMDDEKLVEKGKNIQSFLNKNLSNIVKEIGGGVESSTLYVEFEKIYKRIIFQPKSNTERNEGAKKRYAGLIIWEDGNFIEKLKIAGMAARRSEVATISRELQTGLLTKILKGEEKQEIIKYIRDIITKIKNGEISKEAISLKEKLERDVSDYKNKNIPKLRGVDWSNKNIGTRFEKGMKFMMIYVKDLPTNVVCFEDEDQVKNIKIDYTTTIDKCVLQKIKTIFMAMDWGDEYNKFVTEILKKNKSLMDF